jgi:hypothetical protein
MLSTSRRAKHSLPGLEVEDHRPWPCPGAHEKLLLPFVQSSALTSSGSGFTIDLPRGGKSWLE